MMGRNLYNCYRCVFEEPPWETLSNEDRAKWDEVAVLESEEFYGDEDI